MFIQRQVLSVTVHMVSTVSVLFFTKIKITKCYIMPLVKIFAEFKIRSPGGSDQIIPFNAPVVLRTAV